MWNIVNFGAISNFQVDSLKCEGCGVCKLVCDYNAIELKENEVAEIIEEKAENNSILIKANMKIGADGSGRLISEIIRKSKKYNKLKIVDGSPGIGCPVIATLTETNVCILVTEPTMSGINDLDRIYKLSLNFSLKLYVCINKYNINQDITNQIEKYCEYYNIEIIGKIPYDDMVIESIGSLKPIVLYENSKAGLEIINISNKLIEYIERNDLKWK